MPPPDLDRMFAEARAAWETSDLHRARRLLGELVRHAPRNAEVLHLIGLVADAGGQHELAARAFADAVRLAPDRAAIRSDYAGFLAAHGQAEAAIAQYDAALAVDPGQLAIAYNRAATLGEMGDYDAAEAAMAALEPSLAEVPDYWAGRAETSRRAGELVAALEQSERTLAVQPGHAAALRCRALATEELQADEAGRALGAALAKLPTDPALILAAARSSAREGNTQGAETLLGRAVEQRPLWSEGHEALSAQRHRRGDPDFDRSFGSAIAAQPDQPALWRSRARFHAGLDAPDTAADIARAMLRRFPDDEETLLAAAIHLGAAGDSSSAGPIFARLKADTLARLRAEARHALRIGDPTRAEALLARAIGKDDSDIAAWALRDLAWRLLDDPRREWLHGQPGLVSEHALSLDPGEIDAIASHLRALHTGSRQPWGQSVRGGSQTEGRLFSRPDKAIGKLRDAIAAAIETARATLPPVDSKHPLLRHRDGPFRFAGTWSIRLTASGFHASHLHPEGLMSSACYLALPDDLGHDDAGCFELGRPPSDLGLDLPPLRTIRPAPGKLILFPSTFYHGTRPFAEGERLTVAFDLVSRR